MGSQLAVNEIFGATFQGEGRNIGMPCFFLRLAGCNLACQWCDTPYTWDWKRFDPKQEIHPMSMDEILRRLTELQHDHPRVHNLVISGGEPMLQQKNLMPLVENLRADNWWVEMETAGTRVPAKELYVNQFTVSPKLENSGNPVQKRHVFEALDALVRDPRSVFKFVVSDLRDFKEIDALEKQYGFRKPFGREVYIMPEGIDKNAVEQHAQQVAEAAIQRGYKLTTRMQILLYGNRRAV